MYTDIAENEGSSEGMVKSCKAVDQSTGVECGETESLTILREFQKLYEDRVRRIDGEVNNELERSNTKLQVMREWINNLEDQNAMLVETVRELEYAAATRVKLLEEKLRQSSSIVSRSMSRSNYTEEAINRLSERIAELEKDERFLREKVNFLRNDIACLLELIRRGTANNNWTLEGLEFLEIQREDISAAIECACEQEKKEVKPTESLRTEIEELRENERKMLAYQTELEKKIGSLTEELRLKNEAPGKETSGALENDAGRRTFSCQEPLNMSQVFKSLEKTIGCTMTGLNQLEADLVKIIQEGPANSPARFAMILMSDKLKKHKEDLNASSDEVGKLRDTLSAKDKLLENMEEIIRIQKDSISMTQAELKELHQKLQDKINSQEETIERYKQERAELLRQNELQVQTIGHLQQAVVEAKRSVDQMAQRTATDVSDTRTFGHGNVQDV